MSRLITIAAVQLPVPLRGKQTANFAAAEDWLNQAGRQGADLACMGETFNILGIRLTRKTAPSLVRGSLKRALARFAPIARRHKMAIIAPILAVLDGKLRNVAVVIDRSGKPAGHYAKVHCTESERGYGVVPGDAWPTFRMAGARIGIQICHDNSFPESARCLALNGAEIIFWPHVMSGWGGEFMDILRRSPAIHDGIHHVPVCFGCPPGVAWRPGMMIGRSSIVGPDATVIADAGRRPGIALARIDLDAPRIAHGFTRDGDHVWRTDMLNDRRPETYGPIGRPKPGHGF